MKILINEANEDIKTLYQAIFSPYEADITFADDVNEAEEYAKNGGYDLVFLEVGFPDMEGIMAADRLVNKNPDQSLVLVSSVPINKTVISEAIKYPVRYFMKPFDIQSIRTFLQYQTNRLAASAA